jgi:ribosome-associated protein
LWLRQAGTRARSRSKLNHETAINHDTEIVGWVRTALAAADEKQGGDSVAFLVGEVLGITDWFLITSGRNPRQVKAIVEAVEEHVAIAGGPRPRQVEGLDTLDWVLMDFGSFVVHVFDDETRRFYDLERLWRDVPRLEAVS